MQVIREFDNFSETFSLLNSLLKACGTPYTFPVVMNVKGFVKAYTDIQFERSIDSSGFGYIDFHLQVNERTVSFDYVSTSNTVVSAEFDSGLWGDERGQYSVTVELPLHRCRKDGFHYNVLTQVLFDDTFEEGWLDYSTGRINSLPGLKGLPTPEWVLKRRSNFILWNTEDQKLIDLLFRRGFLANNSWVCTEVFERNGYMIAYQKRGYASTFTCCDPGETLYQGVVFNSLLDVLGWVDRIEVREQHLSRRRREFLLPDEDYEDYDGADDDYDWEDED